MVFTTKKVESPTFGDKLKEAREEAGLSKQKVAQLLNIQLRHLEGLEQGDIEKMPADVYAKGLLRKYAKILGVESESLVREYEKEVKIANHLKRGGHQSLPSLRLARFSVTPKFLTAIFGSLLFILAVGYLVYQLNVLISPPKLVIFEPVDNLLTGNSTIVIAGQTESGAQLTINSQQTYIDRDGNFKQEINLNPGINTIEIKAINRFEKSRQESRKILLE